MIDVGPGGGEADVIVRLDGHTVWVDGDPRGGPEALAHALVRGDVAHPGAWSAVVRPPAGPARAHVAPFAGSPLYTDGSRASHDPSVFDVQARPVDVEGVRQHLLADPRDPTSTLAFGVRRVPEGHAVLLDGLLRIERAWRPVPAALDEPVSAVRSAVEQAIGHVPARPTPTVALSGGLDSSIVALVLASRGPVRAVSNRFPGTPADEGSCIEAVCERGSLPRQDVDSRDLDPLEVLEHLGPPGFPPIIPNHHLNLALMRRAPEGLVTGFGGDEVIGHGLTLAREQWWAGRPVQAIATAGWLAWRFRHGGDERFAARWVRGVRGAVLARPAPPVDVRLGDMLHPWVGRSRDELARLARAVRVPVHTPFLDPSVAAVLLGVSTADRVRRGRTRWVLRAAFADVLPDAVARRPDKADLSPSFVGPFVRRMPDRRAWLEDGTLDRWVPRATLRAQWDLAESGDAAAAAGLWRAVGTRAWLAWHTSGGSVVRRAVPASPVDGRAGSAGPTRRW